MNENELENCSSKNDNSASDDSIINIDKNKDIVLTNTTNISNFNNLKLDNDFYIPPLNMINEDDLDQSTNFNDKQIKHRIEQRKKITLSENSNIKEI